MGRGFASLSGNESARRTKERDAEDKGFDLRVFLHLFS